MDRFVGNECGSLSVLSNKDGQRYWVNLAHGQIGWVRIEETTSLPIGYIKDNGASASSGVCMLLVLYMAV